MNSSRGPFRWLVVGGGAAGCWLARRLAQSNAGAVGLIEAGGAARDARSVAPAWYPRAQGTRLDWGFRTEPQGRLGGRQLAWPRGRALGGSSAINALIYLFPAQGDLERWSRAVGGRWADNLAAIAQRLESLRPNADSVTCPISGLNLQPVSAIHPWCRAFLDSAAGAGLKSPAPWIQSQPDACGEYWLTQQRGRRQTTASALLEEASLAPGGARVSSRGDGGGQENLSIISDCTATRLIIRQGRAVAVQAQSSSGALSFEAEEIVLAAGAIGSPALLLRSGIGPAADLHACGVECQVDAPQAGANLQDHLVMPVVYQMRSGEGLPYRFDAAARRQFRESASGPLASNIAEVGALLGTVRLADAPECEASRTPRFQLHVTPTHYLKYPRLAAATDAMSIAVTPLHPASRGRLRLARRTGKLADSPEANHGLEIDPQYLEDPRDIEDFWQAYAWVSQAVGCGALRELIDKQLMPAAARSDAAGIGRTVRAMAQSIYHPVGTCRAGSDAQSVVDDRFCVRGVAGLRVADASVLPDLPSGNTLAAALLMAELAATELVGSGEG